MRTLLTVLVATMLGVMPLCAQPQEEVAPPPPPPEEAQGEDPATQPYLIDEVVPAQPTPPRTLQEELVDRAIRYYEQTQEAPPEVGAYLARNPWLGTVFYVIRRLSSVLIWLFLLLLIGIGGRKLLRPLLGAPAASTQQPAGYSRERASTESPAPDRRTAAADLVAWLVALAIACEAVGLPWFGSLWSGLMELAAALVGAIVWLALLIALAALIAWSFSAHGRRLVLSLLGYFYLRRSSSRPPEGHPFTLADGREAVIVRTDALHSLMQPTDGTQAVAVPNAEIMEQYYHWAAGERKAGSAPAEAGGS